MARRRKSSRKNRKTRSKKRTRRTPKYDVVVSTTIKGVSKARAEEIEKEAKGKLGNARVYKKKK